jgi:hypothetical protein
MMMFNHGKWALAWTFISLSMAIAMDPESETVDPSGQHSKQQIESYQNSNSKPLHQESPHQAQATPRPTRTPPPYIAYPGLGGAFYGLHLLFKSWFEDP